MEVLFPWKDVFWEDYAAGFKMMRWTGVRMTTSAGLEEEAGSRREGVGPSVRGCVRSTCSMLFVWEVLLGVKVVVVWKVGFNLDGVQRRGKGCTCSWHEFWKSK